MLRAYVGEGIIRLAMSIGGAEDNKYCGFIVVDGNEGGRYLILLSDYISF